VRVQGNATLVSQLIGVTAPGDGGTTWLSRSFTFVADSPATLVAFDDNSPTTLNVDLVIDNVRVTLQNSATITSQPQSLTTPVGANATFSVTATGQAPLTYQWRFNGSNIAGATSSTFTQTNVQAADGGNYDVVVSNGSGPVTSAVATLTVVPAGTVLANGSFESSSAGWTASGNLAFVSNAPYSASAGIRTVAFNGSQTTPNGVLSQTFTTTPGQTYALAFDIGVLSGGNQTDPRLQVTVQGSGTLLNQTATIAAPPSGVVYSPRSFTFVANSTTTKLTFADVSLDTMNVDLLLDNVRITPQ
jgi:Ig-like domain-containing protein/uncharacterized protein DUF642